VLYEVTVCTYCADPTIILATIFTAEFLVNLLLLLELLLLLLLQLQWLLLMLWLHLLLFI
jgi:hypothetical protein